MSARTTWTRYVYQSDAQTVADPVPGVPAGPIVSAAGFQIKNLTPLGYSARNVPFTGTGNGVYNSDLAFKDNLVFAGTYEGFRVIDVTNKSNPTQLLNYTGCDVGQGDVDRLREHPDPLVGRSASSGRDDLRGPGRRPRASRASTSSTSPIRPTR